MVKSALILGVSGQDGAYLSRVLLDKGYRVFGTSRDKEMSDFSSLTRMGIKDRVTLMSVSPADFRSISQAMSNVRPEMIFNLAAQSSVGLSFEQPAETLHSTVIGPLNVLEAMRLLKLDARFYNASSSECFGNIESGAADERTPFRPRSPYGVGKSAAHWTVANYREAYGLFACSGLLFNHESPLRPRRFVTQKIISGAADIAEGKKEGLGLGNLAISRDFGWAPEYVDAMVLMLEADRPDDYVVATGQTNSLQEFVEAAFNWFGLDWKRHVVIDPALHRPTDIARSAANPDKARVELGWQARTKMEGVVAGLAEAELRRRRGEVSF